MPRPRELYVSHTLDAADIAPEARYQKIAQNLSCYGIEVVNNRRPEQIIARHTTISGVHGDFCSALGSQNETIYDPHKAPESSMYISLLVAGNQHIAGRKKSAVAEVNPGMLIVHQRSDYYHYRCNDVKQLYILPVSNKMTSVFDGKLPAPVVSLEKHPLAAFMKAHMLLLDAQSAALAKKEMAIVVDGLHAMAAMVLADLARERGLSASSKLSHLYNAAGALIRQHYRQHDLCPDAITRLLGCSRANLDRAFSEQRTSVMAQIKSVRLEAAREMLEGNARLRLEQISWLCGYVSHPLFSKHFREKYRVAPKVWRDNYHQLGGSPSVVGTNGSA